MYESFEIRIGKNESGYPVTVSQSAAGDAAGFCELDLQSSSLQAMLTAIAHRRAGEDLLLALGTDLFSAVFQGNVSTAYRACLNSARAREHSLRLRLTIEPPELAALPWEFLFDPQEDAFLAISPQTALVRYTPIPAPAALAAVTLPLRVLVVSSTPQDFPLVDAERGASMVKEALADLVAEGRAEVEIVEHATAATITQAMRRVRPHIFHFIGHGSFDNDRAMVLLEDEAGKGRAVSDRAFREFLTGHADTRLVILSACQSATVSAQQPLVGLAPRLLQRQVSAVVAMQYPIPQEAAFIFARDFYRSVALGYPLEAAVSEGRRGIYLEGSESDWGIPVLFLRAQDGVLFAEKNEVQGSAGSMAPTIQIEEVASGAQVIAGDLTGVAAHDISGTVISGITGDVHIMQTAQAAVQPPPAPLPPPVPEGFVGRERELAVYTEMLRSTGRAIITGMPGVGKTALAAKLALNVSPPDKIFWHAFHPNEGVDLLLWGLAGFAAWHGKADLWQLLQRSPQPPPHETLVVSLLHALRGQGYLVSLDDIQYVDEDPALGASIQRLTHALNARDLALIATADRMPAHFTRVEILGGMSLDDVRAFVFSRHVTLEESLYVDLHAKTGGNVELLGLAANALQHAPNPRRVIDQLAHVENIGHYLLSEVDQGLTDGERRVVGALAVLGDSPSKADAVEAILEGHNPRRTLLALASRYLVTAQMGLSGPEYSIHSLLRAFYYDELGRRARQAMHERAGTYYEQEEHDYLRAAQHSLAAGNHVHAARLATGSVRAIVNRGQVRALRLLLEQFEPGQLQREDWVRAKLAHGEVCRIVSDNLAVQASCQEALRTLEYMDGLPDTHLLRAKACRGMGLALEYEHPHEALSWFERGQAELASLPLATPGAHQEAALLQLHAGSMQIALGEFAAALGAVQAAVQGIPAQEEALLAYAYRNLGTIYSYQGDFAQAAHYNGLSLAISRRLHDDLNALAVLNNMGIDKEIAGDWQGAAIDYREAIHLAHQLESVVDQARIGNALAMLNIRRGEYEAAQQALTHAIGMAHEHAIDEGLMYLLHTQADLEIHREQWDAAAQALKEAEQLAGTLDAPYVLVEVLCSQAQLALGTDDRVQALTCVERALELAAELELQLESGKAQRILGQVQLALGNTCAALEAFAQSHQLLEDEPYEAARTKTVWGAALLSAGDEQGATLLHEAVVTFADLGAQRDYVHALALVELPE